MNDIPEDRALRDRIFTIRVDGYTAIEKRVIVTDFLLPKGLQSVNRKPGDVIISKEVASCIVSHVDDIYHEKGVRNLQQAIRDILFKIFFIQENPQVAPVYSFFIPNIPSTGPINITKEMIPILLKEIGQETKSNGKMQSMYL